jgi:hypothetical protein
VSRPHCATSHNRIDQHRNETRSLSLMPALWVKSGTLSLTCEAAAHITKHLRGLLAALGATLVMLVR